MTIAAVLLLCAACSQRVETEEEHALRERSRPILPASAAPSALVTGASSGPGASPSPGVSGVIEAPGLDAPPATAVLFVFVRGVPASGGPPLAVQRLSVEAFPTVYSIGPGDAMLEPAPFPDRVVVEARLDADGDPLSRAPEDLSARSGPVSPGSAGVTLTLGPDGD